MTEILSMEKEYGPPVAPPIHPGEILNEDFLIPMNVTPGRLAYAIGVDPDLVQAIINREERVTPEIAATLSRFFGTSAGLWTGLQAQYDLDFTEDRQAGELGPKVDYWPE